MKLEVMWMWVETLLRTGEDIRFKAKGGDKKKGVGGGIKGEERKVSTGKRWGFG